ncbi:AraC family transcriptional regulator [Jiella avicenniae]|uniref:AraC family transcriptional regulator n=1 Tax=Jiella avicenniae TaxID=2907202 RepID=A0A9X1NWE6_9HYPH|nr:AraC family transcriptional regulator [Jiella avicenniae]MCE7026767.1 AraC family transcriptional regulator [Jiella avicenniae]
MAGRDRIRFSRDPSNGVEAISARFFGHAYDMHHHDDWLVGVTDHGVQDFFCRGARRQSTRDRIILIEPGEMHDGQAVTEDGFAYEMLYVPQAVMREGLGDHAREEGGFRQTLSDDPLLAGAIRSTCAAIAEPRGRLAREAGLDRVIDRLRAHLGFSGRTGSPAEAAPVIARRARERLHDEMAAEIGADDLAAASGAANRFALARAFRAAYGSSPHAYLVRIRLIEARRLLAEGESPAAVAAACGFADQSHLGRWFRRAFAITPGAYRAACTGVPDERVV